MKKGKFLGEIFMSKMAEISAAITRMSELVVDFYQQTEEVRDHRLKEYYPITKILLGYYGEKGSAYSIDPLLAGLVSDLSNIKYGRRPINPTYEQVLDFLKINGMIEPKYDLLEMVDLTPDDISAMDEQ